MLYLGAGTRQVKVGAHQTLYLFPDFSDRQQFYYLPNVPHIARMDDGSPAIRLLVFREDLDTIGDDDPEAVGFLMLDVELAWPPEVIEKAANTIRGEDALPEKPRLTPIFFRSGSVKLMLLDAVTPDPDAGPSTGVAVATQFVTRIIGAASPSLYGDNRAIFQASLSKKGAAALSGALDGVTPIGVVYSLIFAGLQPAFNVKARVDWKKVYDHFSTKEQADFLFYESDVQKSIDKLIEDKVIVLDETVEGIGAEAMDAERESAMNSIRQLIFDKFFEATFQRVDPAGGGTASDIVDTLTHIHQNALTLGIGYTYHRKEVRIEELRTLNLDWTARRATERTIYPQAHMHNLVTGSGITLDTLVTLTNPEQIWKALPFEIMAAAAWETDGIVGVTVDLEYTDGQSGTVHSKSEFLNKDKSKTVYREWMDRTSGNKFRYKYSVAFLDGGVPGFSSKASSGAGWIEQEGTVLVVNPRELYDVVQLEVMMVPEFPFNRWLAVQAFLRYRSDDGSFQHAKDAVLTAASRTFQTRCRVDRKVPGSREVRLSYSGATGERVDTPWMPMFQDQQVVEDPRPDKLVVRAIVAGDRQNIANVAVDLEYTDTVGGIHERGALNFDATNINEALSWTVNLVDPLKRRYRYRLTVITKAGDPLQTGWISTDAPTLPVGEVYVRRLTVEFATGELGPNVEAIEVKVAYHDAANDVHDEKVFRLGPGSVAEWQLQLKDASKRSYSLTTTWIRSDGFNPKVGPTTTSETYVPIAGTPPGPH